LAGAENTPHDGGRLRRKNVISMKGEIPSLRGVELSNILGRINVPSGEDFGI
jgi:hypothetical protein